MIKKYINSFATKSIFAFALLCMSFLAEAQTTVTYDFNANATGWTGNITRTTATTACGSASMRRNLYASVTTGNMVSPAQTSNGQLVSLSYKYKVANWSANTVGTPNPWGNFNVQYGPSATGPWTTVQTIDATNHTVSGTCTTATTTFTPPTGTYFIKWDAFYAGTGDYYLNYDDVVISQAAATPCTGTPAPGNTLSSAGTVTCGSLATTLSIQTIPAGTGVTYQWYLNSVAIPSATSSTYAATAVAAGDVFYCDVTCAGVTTASNPITFSAFSAPGNTTSTASANICAPATTAATTLGIQNAAPAGATYQWYLNGAPILSATSATYATTANIGDAFYCEVTCAGSVSTSSTITFAASAPPYCGYCVPTYTTGKTDGDLISNISISGTTLANNSGTAQVNPAYTSFTPPAYTAPNYTCSLQAGSTYNVTITVGTWGTQGIAAWIDYNDDGVFATSERIGFTPGTIGTGTGGLPIPANHTASFPITLSCSPPLGIHRLRVRDVYNQSGGLIDPCNTQTYGETEDYLVEVTTADPCPTPSAMTGTPGGNTASLSWTAGCVETQWSVVVQAPGTGVPTTGPDDPAHPKATTNSGHIVTGLTGLTTYEVYYGADCQGSTPPGTGGSSWAGPYTFTTTATCFPPTALAASNITSSGADIGYTAPSAGTPANYDYYVSTTATAPTAATTPTGSITAATTPLVLSTLSPSTLYYVWMRSDCGSGDLSTWSLNTSFTTLAVPCAGTPAPGNTVATPANVCSGGSTTLSVQNATSGTGVTYQWYSGPVGGPYTAISGANASTYAATGITAATEFYCEVTCATGPAMAASTNVTVGLNAAYLCYCASIPGSTGDEEIFVVDLTSGASTMTQSSDCITAAPGAGSILNRYSNFTGTTPLNADLGSPVNFSITLNTCGGTFNNGCAIFIDYNQDGDFDDAGEKVADDGAVTIPTTPAGRIFSGSFTVPTGALTGLTGLRVINAESVAGSTITGCQVYSYGETEDYLINLTTPPACSGTPAPGNTVATPASICSGNTSVLSLQNATTGTGVTYQWYNSSGAISGANSATYTTPALTASETYYCEVTCSGNVGTSGTATVSINPGLGSSSTNPIVISPISSFSSTMVNSTANCFSNNSTLPGNGGLRTSPEIYYQFTLPSASSVSIDLCASSYDNVVSLYNSTLTTEIAYNDDAGPLCAGAQASLTQASLAAGTYFIVVQGFSGVGTNVLSFSSSSLASLTTISYPGCNGQANKAIEVTGTSGLTGTITYSCVDASGPAGLEAPPGVFTQLAAGTYTVSATDGAATASTVITIAEPPALSGTFTFTAPTCNGGSDGSVTVSGVGGTPYLTTPTYSIDWYATAAALAAGTPDISGATNNAASFATIGNYTVTVEDSLGCIVQVTGITITQPAIITGSSAHVGCNSLTVAGVPYTASGSHTATFTAANGCDSVHTYNVTINMSNTGSSAVTACNSVTIAGANGGAAITTSGAYPATFTNAAGCDSVHTYNVTINVSNTGSSAHTGCNSLTVAGVAYTASGSHTATFTNAAGCDSVHTYNVTINNSSAPSTVTINQNGGSYTIPGTSTTYFASATHVETYANVFGCDSVVTYNITINLGVLVSPKVCLAGPLDAAGSLMSDSLRQKNLIPGTTPYGAAPYTHIAVVGAGGEMIDPAAYSNTGSNTIVDWVLVELRDASNSNTVVATRSALLQRDGDVVDVDGNSAVLFTTVGPGNYFVSVKHRNHLGVMGASTFALNSLTSTLTDFTATSASLFIRPVPNSNTTFGATRTIAGKRALYAGNCGIATAVTRRQLTYNSTTASDRYALLTAAPGTATINGYTQFDCDLNGFARFNGLLPDRLIILMNVSNSNTLILHEQTPN
ncbi:MAG: hypothetical protein RL660_943 [Bacteroidota bacterium]